MTVYSGVPDGLEYQHPISVGNGDFVFSATFKQIRFPIEYQGLHERGKTAGT